MKNPLMLSLAVINFGLFAVTLNLSNLMGGLMCTAAIMLYYTDKKFATSPLTLIVAVFGCAVLVSRLFV